MAVAEVTSPPFSPSFPLDGPEIRTVCDRMGWTQGLRSVQKRVLGPLFEGKNLIAVLPTSAGKSGIFQVPALVRPGLVVVVSPLVALMADQVHKLKQLGIPAVLLNSHCSLSEKKQAMDAVKSGTARILYVSPERMLGMDAGFFDSTPIQLYAIDEAHCISEWGHDFRPAYFRLGRSLSRFPKAQILALTATATLDVIEEIGQVLGIGREVQTIRFSPDRPNIAYGIAGRKTSLVRMVETAALPCLVYGSTRKGVEEASVFLSRSGYRAAHYHAGMAKNERTDVQKRFMEGEFQVITATCAFGMGIDHAGIRSVVHLEMPTSLEAYAQETGRAGRDGAPSRAICRATVETLDIAKSLVPLTWPTPTRVQSFWHSLGNLFEWGERSWYGEGKLQLSNEAIAHEIGMHPLEVSSCLRILQDADQVKRISSRDQPFEISLLSGARVLRGKKQREILDTLEAHADIHGNVVGTEAFFVEEIGLEKSYAEELSKRGALRVQWVDQCQVLERCHSSPAANLDAERILAIRQRALHRIEKARGFLSTPLCRREYLLQYFGDSSGGRADGICCDRCHKNKRKET